MSALGKSGQRFFAILPACISGLYDGPLGRGGRDGDAGWSSPVARQAHNLKVVGSNPTPATKNTNKIKNL